MSVLKNKRNLSSAQFLENLKCLEQEVLIWCKSQGRKNDNFGLTDLFNATKNAYVCAVMANSEFPKDLESVEYRKEWFRKSISSLHLFNSQLTALCVCFPISNTRIKRWMKYVNMSKSQMENVMKSDKKRIKK